MSTKQNSTSVQEPLFQVENEGRISKPETKKKKLLTTARRLFDEDEEMESPKKTPQLSKKASEQEMTSSRTQDETASRGAVSPAKRKRNMKVTQLQPVNPDEVADDDNVTGKAVFTVIPTEREYAQTPGLKSLSTVTTAANSPQLENLKQAEAPPRGSVQSSKFLGAPMPDHIETMEFSKEERKFDPLLKLDAPFILEQGSSPGKRGRKAGATSQGTGYLAHFNGLKPQAPVIHRAKGGQQEVQAQHVLFHHSTSGGKPHHHPNCTGLKHGRWTKDEHFRFLEALKLFGKEWRSVQKHVCTRTSTQARSHAQKFFVKIEKRNQTLEAFLENLDLQNIENHLVFSDLDDGDEVFVPMSGPQAQRYFDGSEDKTPSLDQSDHTPQVTSPAKKAKSPKKEFKPQPSSPLSEKSRDSIHSIQGSSTTMIKERAKNGVMDLGFDGTLQKLTRAREEPEMKASNSTTASGLRVEKQISSHMQAEGIRAEEGDLITSPEKQNYAENCYNDDQNQDPSGKVIITQSILKSNAARQEDVALPRRTLQMRQSKYNHAILQKRYREDDEIVEQQQVQEKPRTLKKKQPAEELLGLKRFKSESNGNPPNLGLLPVQKPTQAPKVTGVPSISMTPSLKHSDPQVFPSLYDDDIFNVKRSNSHEYEYIADHHQGAHQTAHGGGYNHFDPFGAHDVNQSFHHQRAQFQGFITEKFSNHIDFKVGASASVDIHHDMIHAPSSTIQHDTHAKILPYMSLAGDLGASLHHKEINLRESRNSFDFLEMEPKNLLEMTGGHFSRLVNNQIMPYHQSPQLNRHVSASPLIGHSAHNSSYYPMHSQSFHLPPSNSQTQMQHKAGGVLPPSANSLGAYFHLRERPQPIHPSVPKMGVGLFDVPSKPNHTTLPKEK
ncbi:hypothetical protein FGO68_gene6994 [Halteria grandinella]|uniref:Uncharacterized protein n=1 Tax=Halteria grandinella TaxID=5974 RepID=A0A8J8NYY4_HALGN|nr:hypothetical protein FGO68_gene6994 [Halteria grandinella]